MKNMLLLSCIPLAIALGWMLYLLSKSPDLHDNKSAATVETHSSNISEAEEVIELTLRPDDTLTFFLPAQTYPGSDEVPLLVTINARDLWRKNLPLDDYSYFVGSQLAAMGVPRAIMHLARGAGYSRLDFTRKKDKRGPMLGVIEYEDELGFFFGEIFSLTPAWNFQ